jgi:hypothetical protein
MDTTNLNMVRVATEDCYSQSVFPETYHHQAYRLMWKKGELIQIVNFPGGDLHIAIPLHMEPGSVEAKRHGNQLHIWKREFRELTTEERNSYKLGRPGEQISKETREIAFLYPILKL